MAPRCIEPAKGPVEADFLAMPSKSATHRALMTAALAEGVSEIRGPLEADDTRRSLEGLRQLGVRVDERDGAWSVHGTAGALAGGGTIDLGASGSSARFLTALATLGEHPSMLDGSSRLRERPMDELLEALSTLGARIETSGQAVYPIRAGGSAVSGGAVTLSGARSSQFASALLLAAPAFRRGLRLEVAPPRVSFSYVGMTVDMLEAFGAKVARTGAAGFWVPPQKIRTATVGIEGDHSSASYLLVAAAILGGRVAIRGIRADSSQPDARFLNDLAALGSAITHDSGGVVVEAPGRVPAFAWDLTDAPDLAPTAAVLALFAAGPCTLSGLWHLALKESDRLAVLRDNLVRLGARVSSDQGTLSIVPPPRGRAHGGTIHVAGDHRIAMAFAVAGLAVPGVVIDDPEVVAKSYPRFWDDLAVLVRTGS
jgi:3-phosphoshikimate 1-carboxyvinyltransferase